jgi:uncharacterized protein involved in outer membrane biogenesis
MAIDRQPINRHMSEQLGRRFEITQHLAVRLGLTSIVRAEGVEFANPEWASEPYLVKASTAEFDIELFPLLLGKLVLPRVVLTGAKIGLQIEPDGRRTWALSRDTSDESATPDIGVLLVKEGSVHYRAVAQGANIVAQFTLAEEADNSLPLGFKAKGKWKNEAFSAEGRTGGVLQLNQNSQAPFPVELSAVAGRTSLPNCTNCWASSCHPRLPTSFAAGYSKTASYGLPARFRGCWASPISVAPLVSTRPPQCRC